MVHTLALWADVDGRACPSVATVAAAVGVSERTVQKAFAAAEALGWLSAPDRQKRKGGARGNTVWRQLAVPTSVPTDTPTPVPADTPIPVPGDAEGASRGTDEVAREVGPPQRARPGAEHPEFAALVEGVGLARGGRAEVYAAWQAEPQRVAACVAEWWRRRERNLVASPGLLVTMVRDGDDPSHTGRKPRRDVAPPCPHCEVGGGRHASDCPLAEKADVVA